MATSVMGTRCVDDPTVVVVDVNGRQAIIADRRAYVERIGRVASRADIVKVSDEDFAYLSPGVAIEPPAERCSGRGHARSSSPQVPHTRSCDCRRGDRDRSPTGSGRVVDTIGAGDTFGAGVLAWWSAAGVGRDTCRSSDYRASVRIGHAASAVVVTRHRGPSPVPVRSRRRLAVSGRPKMFVGARHHRT